MPAWSVTVSLTLKVPGRGVGVRRVGRGRVGRAVAVEVPRVGQRGAFGVDRAGARELHRQRDGPVVLVDRGVRDRASRALDVVDPEDAGVGVVAVEAAAPVDDVERAVRPELHLVDARERVLPGRHGDVGDRRLVGVQRRGLDPAVVPLADEPLLVVEGRELRVGVQVRRRTCSAGRPSGRRPCRGPGCGRRSRCSPSTPTAGLAGGRLVRPVLLGELLTGAAQLNFGAGRAGREVVVVVGDVVADAVRPAIEAGRDDVVLDRALRAAVRVGRAARQGRSRPSAPCPSSGRP